MELNTILLLKIMNLLKINLEIESINNFLTHIIYFLLFKLSRDVNPLFFS